MRVASVNGKRYILVIFDDYSQFIWVKCLRSKYEAPNFIIKFLKMIKVRLKVHVRRIRTDNGTEFVNQTLREYYEKVGISYETSVAHSPQQNGAIERRNRTLIEVAHTMLIYANVPLFLWAEAVAIAYFDELTSMASKHGILEPALHEMNPATISSGLVLNPPPSTLFVPPSRTDWDILFQPLFDELLNPLSSVDRPAPEVIAPITEIVAPKPVVSTGSPSSTTVDQDAPSPSNSQKTPETQSPVISNDVEEENHDLDCGVNLINGICLNCTYGDGKPVTCCGCEGPLNGGFCSFCASRAGNSFAYDPNPNSFDDSQNLSDYPPQPQYQTYSCELCGNDAHYGYDCPPQVPFVYNQDPCFNQNFDNNFPQTSPSFPQQYLCCENCGGPHETFQCQPMNQNFYNSNSSGFDQIQPPQYYVMHQPPEESVKEFEKQLKTVVISALEGVIQPPQETSVEILQAKEDLMKSIQTFLKKFNRISFRETPKVLSLAWEKFFEIQHAQPEDIQELLHKLLKDLQIISEELAEYINCPSWNRPTFYDDDDEEYTIQYREYLENSSNAITPSDLIESLLNQDTSMVSSPNIESLLEEGIYSADENCYDNSSPRPPEELNSEIYDAIIESFSPSPIPIESSDSLMKEIDIFLAPDDSIPPSIENDDYDSE
ncbi:reverse transcriptase domain-containing protein [Tanacetum coccineum]